MKRLGLSVLGFCFVGASLVCTSLATVYDVRFSEAVVFTSPSQGWIIGSSGIWKSMDGGKHWRRIEVEESSAAVLWFTGGFFHDQMRGWVTAVPGRLFATTDGGRSWIDRSQAFGTRRDLWPVRIGFTSKRHGWILARGFTGDWDEIPGSDLLITTENGGTTWQRIDLGMEYTCDLVFSDARSGWLLTSERSARFRFEGTLCRTDDGGKTWRPISSIFPVLRGAQLGLSGGRLKWLLLPHSEKSPLFITDDDGLSWSPIPVLNTLERPQLLVQGTSRVWIWGLEPSPDESPPHVLLKKSEDLGQSWLRVISQRVEHFVSMNLSFLDRKRGWLVIGDSLDELQVLATEDSGDSWVPVFPPPE